MVLREPLTRRRRQQGDLFRLQGSKGPALLHAPVYCGYWDLGRFMGVYGERLLGLCATGSSVALAFSGVSVSSATVLTTADDWLVYN